jgi:1-acyl-sn-glycerol-3-phosphate acyltransferase
MTIPQSRLLAWFRWYARRYARKGFHALRVAQPGFPSIDPAGPLLVAANHAGWWDPLVGLILAERYLPEREHYAPIDEAMLARYRFFARLGFFGVEPGTRRGATAFLRATDEIFARPGTALWITPQGRFADVRERPVTLRDGVGHAARRMRGGTVLPLAIEYPFWEERTPEALCLWGEPIVVEDGATREPGAWTAAIAAGLESAMDSLARTSIARDSSRFETILGGTAGVGGFYDLWRALRARLRGEGFRREHGRD